MSYYILPKNNKKYKFNVCNLASTENLRVILSHTLFNLMNTIDIQLLLFLSDELNNIIKYFNPYEFVFTNVGNTELSIGKIPTSSNIYYELTEIINTFIFLEQDLIKSSTCLCIGKNSSSCELLLHDHTPKIHIKNIGFDPTHLSYLQSDVLCYDWMIFECIEPNNATNNCKYNLNIEINNLCISFFLICMRMSIGGSAIIKITSSSHKPFIDIMLLLCNVFEKTILFKPLLTNILSNEKYIICNNFNANFKELYISIFEPIIHSICFVKEYIVSSILNNQIQNNYLTKIEEFNAINGQQQLETYDQIINMIHTKNKMDKLETIKRYNIQKGVGWCEKNKIPHNKFLDKLNIFLNLRNES